MGRKRKNIEQFIYESKKIHDDKYDYSLVEYNCNRIKIKIICRKHGISEQRPTRHLSDDGCPECNLNSSGKAFIIDWLNKNKIKYQPQKSFPDYKDKLPLRYDFYLLNQNLLLEYDREPHFKEVKYLGGKQGFKLRQKHNKIKTGYALNNGFNLLCISYIERKNLSKILKNKINEINLINN